MDLMLNCMVDPTCKEKTEKFDFVLVTQTQGDQLRIFTIGSPEMLNRRSIRSEIVRDNRVCPQDLRILQNSRASMITNYCLQKEYLFGKLLSFVHLIFYSSINVV